MSAPSSVVVYETKPATEWLLGRPVQKMSPRRTHAVLQGELYVRLAPWARGRGRVGPEWRFWLQPSGEATRYLVPDVAYLSYGRLSRASHAEAEEPHLAPDVAFEILSPGDRAAIVKHKIDVYLRSGTLLVVVVDPEDRLIRTFDLDEERTTSSGEIFHHPALPDFEFDVNAFFASVDE